jgi:outer membrane protein OmpA-like peptidoglycan-associated protein
MALRLVVPATIMSDLSSAVHSGRLPALMRPLFLLLAIPLLAGTPARAQVTVNLNALDVLPSPQAAEARPARHAVRRVHRPQHLAADAPTLPVPPVPPAAQVATSAPAMPPKPVAPATPAPATPTPPTSASAKPVPAAPAPATSPPAATIPAAPPPVVALAPLPPATPSAAPPAAPPVAANAESVATPTAGGLTIAFGSDQSDLNAASDAAIQKLAHTAPNRDTTSFNVLAFAHGDPQDPSTARRLSLSRALAIRSALMAAGVPSTRVYVRALGDQGGKGPPDRADITVMGLNAPAATAAATPGSQTGGKEE